MDRDAALSRIKELEQQLHCKDDLVTGSSKPSPTSVVSLPCTDGNSIEQEDLAELKRIRDYFGVHDMTCFEHWAFAFLDAFIKKHKP
jgi:hypothetical protein